MWLVVSVLRTDARIGFASRTNGARVGFVSDVTTHTTSGLGTDAQCITGSVFGKLSTTVGDVGSASRTNAERGDDVSDIVARRITSGVGTNA